MTPYRLPERATSGSLAWWTAPRAAWWRRLLWWLPSVLTTTSGYGRWLRRLARQCEREWLREIARALADIDRIDGHHAKKLALDPLGLGDRITQLTALIRYRRADALSRSMLHYKPSMLRGERGRRELEAYFSKS